MNEYRKGILYGLLCYCIWGLFPLYWRMLEHVSSFEILAHRILWSCVFMVLFFKVLKRWRLKDFIKTPGNYLMLLVTGILITFNWGLYIWAINDGRILESSLGYYINPLVNVLLGYLFLHERLNKMQCVALFFASAGVLYFTIKLGHFPWVSLGLAFSFAIYGLFKKKMGINATPAMTVETLWMMPLSVIYITLLCHNGSSALNSFDLSTWLLLLFAGVVTAVPLLLYGKSAERIPLSTLGFLQYISPTGQFLIGLLVYKEQFSSVHFICFGCIWTALTIFTIDMVRGLKHNDSVYNANEDIKVM